MIARSWSKRVALDAENEVTTTVELPEPAADDTYVITGDALARLLIDAGFTPSDSGPLGGSAAGPTA